MADKAEVEVILNRGPSLMSYICCCANTRDETAVVVIRRSETPTITPTVTESQEEEPASIANDSNHEETPLLVLRSPVTTHTPIIVRGMLFEMLRMPSDEVYL